VAGEEEIPRKALEMVYGNGVNAKTITAKEMETLLKPPEEVKSIILPKSKTAVMTPEGYTAGFAATSEPRESMTSFIGNIEAGLAYFDPISDRHPVYDTLVRQTMYIGEHSDAWYSGIQPEITIFAQGRRGDMDVNLNMGLYGNNWIDSETRMRKESFTLSLNSSDQSIVFGDFYENISSLSISGRKLTGFRYTGDLMPMGRGMKRISYELAAGESEIARDSGDHELDRVEVVDSGFSVRQQLSYVASVTTKPTHYSSISARAVVARDQTDEPLLRDPITDPGVADPVAAQMGVIDGSLLLLGGKLSLTAEVALGAHDTINSLDVDTTFLDDGDIRVDTLRNRHEDFYEIAWYNPQIFSRAIPRVFGLMHPDSNGYAVALGAEGTLRGYDLALTFVELAQDFFSAGNPYMEADKRQVSLTGEKEYSDRMSGLAGYRWEQVGVSRGYERKKKPKADSPEQRHTVEVRSELGFGDKLPVLSLDYYGRVEHGTVYEDTSDALSLGTSNAEEQNNLEFRNGASVELRQRFDWGLDYSVRYRIVHDNDLTEYVDRSNENIEDGLTNELNTRINYRLRRRLRNRSAFRVGYKSEVRDSARTFYYKLSDRISIGIIPRKLTLGLGAGYEGRIERELDSYTGERKTIRYRLLEGEGDLRYSLTPEMSATIEGQYRRVYDEMQGAENYRVKVVRGFVTYLF
jgi:hypothetical protein